MEKRQRNRKRNSVGSEGKCKVRNKINSKKAVLLLGVCMIFLFLLQGCSKNIKITTGLAKNEIFKIAGETEHLNSILLLLINEKNEYEQSLGEDIWSRNFDDINLETEIKEKIKKQLIELNVIYHMAKQDEVLLSSEETEKLERAAADYYEGLGESELTELAVTKEQVQKLYEKMYLSDKYYEIKTTENQREISDEDAKVIEVMYIFFKTGDRDIHGNVISYDEATVSGIYAKAQSVLGSVQQGGDFKSLADNYSDDSNYRTVFGRGTMEENFEQAAFMLSDGECSGIVQTEDGLYIIKCVEDYLPEETEANKDALSARYRAESFKQIYEPYLKKQTLEFNSKVWDKIAVEDYKDCKDSRLFTIYNTYFEQ